MKKILLLVCVILFGSANAFFFGHSYEEPLKINTDGLMKFPKNEYGYLLNRVYKPNKYEEGKVYPAVVVMPPCTGATSFKKNSLFSWADMFSTNGFVTLQMEHLVPRKKGGPPFNCDGAHKRKVEDHDMVRDLYDAMDALASLDYVNKDQIFAVGFSLGAMTIAKASSANEYKKHGIRGDKKSIRFRAASGLYGGCVFGRNEQYEYLHWDTDKPLLWLMGSADPEAPVASCNSRVKDAMEDVPGFEFHVYEGATHCWDCKDQDGYVRTLPAGKGKHTYRYSEDITRDSQKRVLEYFKKFIANS